MIFARYISEDNEKFTSGKIYIGREVSLRDSCDYSHIRFTDDEGEEATVDAESTDDFEFLEKVYGVWLGLIQSKNLLAGEVVVLDGGDEDTFHVDGDGYLNVSNFELLDNTNLRPGSFVLDKETGQWEKVLSVDGSAWISIGREPQKRRAPTEFAFAIISGAIATNPVLTCKDNTGVSLTKGKQYQLMASKGDKAFIKDDNGEKKEFFFDRFE